MTEKAISEWLMENLVNASIRAGAAAMDIYRSREPIDVSLKSDKSPLTEADRMAHKTIKEYLGATRIPILSEEGREMLYDERRNWELFWLVDPLDGTHEFIERTDEFTINIALMYNKKCVGAAIYVPCTKKLYIASRDTGASLCCDVEPSHDAAYTFEQIQNASQSLPLKRAERKAPIVAISRLHNTPETFTHIESLREKHPDLTIVEQGSSFKFCMLAEGSADYYIRTSTTYEWDTAAGELILAEAGGETRSFPDGEAILYNKENLENPWFTARSPLCTL
ncbi:MAG: 3'(2'),5'-bisphosphate nucleotidase CysQ [Rikenellaceae bacterium]